MSSARIAALLKDYGWVLNLVFIGVAAYFVAGAANAVLARSIRIVPSVDDVAAAQNARGSQLQRPKVTLSSIANRNLFNAKREEVITKGGGAGGDSDAGGIEPGESFNGKAIPQAVHRSRDAQRDPGFIDVSRVVGGRAGQQHDARARSLLD